jgi:hypothetical protein
MVMLPSEEGKERTKEMKKTLTKNSQTLPPVLFPYLH